jgi:hypothetical protein
VQTGTAWIAGIANGFIGGKATRALSLGRRAFSPGQMTSDDKDLDVKEGDESLLRDRLE